MKNKWKSMYDQMELNEQQKNAIWENMSWKNAEAESKKGSLGGMRRIVLPVAAAFAVVILSGTAVLATGTFSVDRIAETMRRWGNFNSEYEEVSQEQKELYSQYSDTLGIKIELTSGTLYLDNFCYDQTYLNIPYRYYPKLEQEAGDPAYDPFPGKFCFRRKGDEPSDNEFLYHHYFEEELGMFRYYDQFVQEDGSITGTLTPYASGERFAQGDVIEICLNQDQPAHTFRLLEEGEDTTGLRLVKDPWGYTDYIYVDQSVPPVVLAEFTLEKTPLQLELAFTPELAAEIPDISIDRIVMSSLSLFVKGSCEEEDDFNHQIGNRFYNLLRHTSVVMQDGSVISSKNGTSGAGFGQDNSFECDILFSEAIDLDQAEWLHIEGSEVKGCEDIDLWIPVH